MFENDDFPMEKNLVAQAMRYVITDQFSTIVRLLELDPNMPDDELHAEILRLCLFDRKERLNPHNVFSDRLNAGDFLPLQPGEDPDNLRPGREPMTDEMLDAAAARARADGDYWNNNRWCRAADIVRAVILAA